ncbi:sulfite exporter TauE/SafE family protein [Kaarinaea lacus]
MLEYPILFAFIVGLLSTIHCVGMCGGIVGALTVSLPDTVRKNRWKLFLYLTVYNFGRLLSYAIAGALIGTLGYKIFMFVNPEQGHVILRWLAGIMMVGVGFYLAGWFPRLAMVETVGKPFWRVLEPLGRRILPVDTIYKAALFGLIWGWLPCGLVYAAVIYSVSTGSAINGALFMMSFGIGTLPAMVTTGMLSGWILRMSRQPKVRTAMGMLIIILALLTIFAVDTSGHMDHSQHFREYHLH